MNHWLLKSEPETYSFDQLRKDKRTNWDHVRNFQARNHLRAAQKGDLALIYHSGGDKAVVGIARVVREAYPDPDPAKPGDWVQIDIEAVKALPRPVALAELKATPALKDLALIKQSQLSCMAIRADEYATIEKLAAQPAAPAPAKPKAKPATKSRARKK